MKPSMTRPYWLGLAALWIVCAIAAWLYASEYQIPHPLVLALLPAFLLEAKFYLILGTESARVKVARILPPAALAAALTASALVPYLAATLAIHRFDWRSFAILLILFLATSFWYVVLPHSAAADLAFVVLVAAVIAGRVFPDLYPVPHRKIPLQILGQLALIRTGIFALLDLRGMKIGFGFIPERRDWQIGALYFVLFLPIAFWLAPALGGLKTHIREPHFTVRDDVAARVREGDVLTVGRHGEFEVLDLQPDGSGLTAIILRGKGGNNAKAAAGLAGRLV